jgi:hypothetical protein
MCASTNTLSPSSSARPSLRSWCRESPSVAAPVFFFQSKDAPAWVGRNEDSLLREAFEKRLLVSATRGGSCAHPDQSRGLALRHNRRAISVSEHLLLILRFFLGGGVALHERLVGTQIERSFDRIIYHLGLTLIVPKCVLKCSVAGGPTPTPIFPN